MAAISGHPGDFADLLGNLLRVIQREVLAAIAEFQAVPSKIELPPACELGAIFGGSFLIAIIVWRLRCTYRADPKIVEYAEVGLDLCGAAAGVSIVNWVLAICRLSGGLRTAGFSWGLVDPFLWLTFVALLGVAVLLVAYNVVLTHVMAPSREPRSLPFFKQQLAAYGSAAFGFLSLLYASFQAARYV